MPVLAGAQALGFIAEHRKGVLVTLKSDGRPQISNVVYGLLDGRIRVSVTASRAKTANLRRDPRVSLHVTSDDFWTYVVAEGEASLSSIAMEPGDETCRRLLSLYETIRSEPHEDPDDFFEAMLRDRRQELSFRPDYLYPTRPVE